jgi:hypothetical protein
MGNLLVLLAVCEHVDSPPRANSWSGLPDMGHVAFQELPRAITQFAAFAVGAQARWLMSSDTSRDVLSNVEHGAFAGLSLSCFAIGATELAKVVQRDIDRAVMTWRTSAASNGRLPCSHLMKNSAATDNFNSNLGPNWGEDAGGEIAWHLTLQF